MHLSAWLMVVFSLGLATSAQAQTQPGTGGVTGQVFCSDTQKPARFATVLLVPDVTETDAAGVPIHTRRGYNSATGSTAVDGSFSIKDVQPGVYDVQVLMPGYLQPVRLLNNFPENTSPMRQALLRMLTKVNVEAGQTASATVTAYRGADLSGTVSYDDGTPASGLTVSGLIAVPGVDGESSSSAGSTTLRAIGSSSQTDDRGRFRLSGLADGVYTVQVLPRNGGLFPVYLGNTIDRSKATLVKAKSGDERSGLELMMDVGNLHRVHGVLSSSDNRVLPNVAITMRLADNATAQLNAETGVDGSFTFAAVPDGRFTVSTSGAYDRETGVMYKASSTQVTVSGSDVNDVALSASP